MVSIEETVTESNLDEVADSSKDPEITPESKEGEWRDLMGSDLRMKIIQSAPDHEESKAVQPDDAVLIDFVGYQAADSTSETGQIFQQVNDWWIVIGEKDVLPALELGVRFMNESETALIWAASKYAYGYGGRDDGNHEALAANSNVLYKVTVKAIASQEQRANLSFQIDLATSKKQIANDVYVNEWCDGMGKARAVQLYKRTAQAMERLLQNDISDDAIRERASQLHLDCLNNIAAVHLRAKEYHLAKKAAVEVLGYDPNNFKGLCRAAKAALLDPASSYEEVDAAIEAAAEQADAATEADVAKLKADFRRRKQLYKKRQKEIFSKIGKGLTGAAEAELSAAAAADDDGHDDNNHSKTNSKENSPESTKENKSSELDDAVDESTGEQYGNSAVAAEGLSFWSRLQSLPWRTRILPYTFQIVLAFAMYQYYLVLKEKQALKLALSTSSEHSDDSADSEF